jgi:23S rRNA (cytosine1962-C5)-methyltransferase
LDLCCYTGGFAIAAATTGRAKHVTAVDLDEQAIAQARRNAAANALRHRPDALRFVHADAFVYARQLEITGQRFDVVLCDPPKFIDSRDQRETARGLRKYEDLNALAAGLVAPGGLLVTCSCSGLLSETGFEEVVARAVHKRNRRMQVRTRHTHRTHDTHRTRRTESQRETRHTQVLNKTGAGEDHPILASCPESRYLKVVWARML